jgi:peptidyl-tRNA hydrolase
MAAAAYVLRPFSGDEAILAAQVTDKAADAVETWLREGIDAAMTRFNGTIDAEKPLKTPNE